MSLIQPMTTAYSFRKPTTPNHCTKPRVIQSATPATSYGPLPPSPPHKHLNQQNSHSQTAVNNNNATPTATTATTTTVANVSACSLDSIRTDLSNESRDVIIGEQWLVLSKIGEGSFGEVFEGIFLFLVLKCTLTLMLVPYLTFYFFPYRSSSPFAFTSLSLSDYSPRYLHRSPLCHQARATQHPDAAAET